MSLLDIQALTVHYYTKRGRVHALEDMAFQIEKGQSLGLVGESGCGKTTAAMAIMGLLAPNAKVVSGKILFKGQDLVHMSSEQMRSIRWQQIAMIFQAAMNALNPVHKVGDQIREAIQCHLTMSPEEMEKKIQDLYVMAGMDPERIGDYPHQYSGGMKQRAVIAMSLACQPDLIIADEPTTALDVIVQDQILREMCRLQSELGMAMLYISHDISIIAETCDKIGIMYAGHMMEYGITEDIFREPLHPYTVGLLSSYPTLKGEKKRLMPIAGEPPNLLSPPQGCPFHPRCPEKESDCTFRRPTLQNIHDGHHVSCHHVGKDQGGTRSLRSQWK